MRDFVYDPFQEEAIEYVRQGHNTFVCAPTGAGKTLIAEELIKEAIQKGEGVIYTAPIKALSNQKFRDFSSQFGDEKVGIVTGDVSLNSSAPIVIMTTEIFRNYIIQSPHKLQDKTWVIFDEIHYLDDIERGTVWEESLILMPQHINFLALSATLPNARQIVSWLTEILNRPVKLVSTFRRPVPLSFYFQCNNQVYSRMEKVEHLLKQKHARLSHPNRVVELVKHLRDNNRLPCIYFSFSRRKCEDLAREMLKFDFMDNTEKREITHLYNQLAEKFGIMGEAVSSDLFRLVRRGIAFHHAGMLPTVKEVVERLFTSRLIKVIFTTETFALGINMPARTVCFDSLVKFYGRHPRYLRTRDFYQMAGRAGRRGIDRKGFVYSRLNPHDITGPVLRKILYSDTEPVNSQFNASYATILNLYAHLKEEIVNIYPLTFFAYQQEAEVRGKGVRLIKSKLNVLREMGYIEKEALTVKGLFSSNIFGYEIIMGELFEGGYLERLSFLELNMLVAAVIFEPRKGQRAGKIPREARRMQNKFNNVMRYIHSHERKNRIWPRTKKPFFHLSMAIEKWSQGASFWEALKFCDVDEGEFVRNIRMCIQVLRDMDNDYIPEVLSKTIKKSIQVINRDIVDAEKQLRTKI